MKKQLELKLVRSVIGTPTWMRTVVRTLGLKKTGARVLLGDSGAIRGMVSKVPHLVSLREVPPNEQPQVREGGK